jgi:hypothetical protein
MLVYNETDLKVCWADDDEGEFDCKAVHSCVKLVRIVKQAAIRL